MLIISVAYAAASRLKRGGNSGHGVNGSSLALGASGVGSNPAIPTM